MGMPAELQCQPRVNVMVVLDASGTESVFQAQKVFALRLLGSLPDSRPHRYLKGRLPD